MQPVGLVPLDGSATAECVLPWAGALARALGLRLLLLDLVEGALPGANERYGASLRPARRYLTGVAQNLVETGLEVETRVQAAGDDVAADIVRVAGELDATLILLATHGRSGVKRIVLGSVADAIVRSATRPVLVVRADRAAPAAASPAVRRLLVPLDGSAMAEQALPVALPLAAATGATIDLVQVVPWAWSLLASAPDLYLPEGLDEQMEQAAAAYLRGVRADLPQGITAEAHVLRGDAASGLLDHVCRTHTDLVVMTTHGRTGLARWTLGSVADKLLRGGKLPVMLVRAEVEE